MTSSSRLCRDRLTAVIALRRNRWSSVIALSLVAVPMHVGSPDAWYDGPAGPYHVTVHIEAPPVIPGIAIVNVRADGADRITAFVNTFDATGGTPPADVAQPVAATPDWHRTRLWVMAAGSNGVTVTVSGSKGTGSVVVPLTAVASRRLTFTGPLAVVLTAAGLFLAAGLLTLVGAAVRESVLPPGDQPDATRQRRARFAMARAATVGAVAVTGMGAWWRSVDTEFTNTLFTSLTVAARVDAGAPHRLMLTITDPVWAYRGEGRVRARGGNQLGDLIEDHGKVVHLFVVATDGRSAFAHLHPTTRDTTSFTTSLPPLPAGAYRVFADVVHSSGFTETLTASVTIPAAPRRAELATDPDDSWATAAPPAGDREIITWIDPQRARVAKEEAGLRFVVDAAPGDTASIEPYLGMDGHAVVVRDDGGVFIHLHPLGTISLAAQAQLAMPAAAPVGLHAPHAARSDTLYFPYAFPSPGSYTVWVQYKRGGRVHTRSFSATVRPGV